MTRLFLCGPLAQIVSGQPHHVQGYALPDDTGCFPLPVEREGAVLNGVISDREGLDLLQEALGGKAQALPDGVVIHVAHDKPGDWNEDNWVGDWGQIAPLAVTEALGYAGQLDAPTLARRMPMILARAGAEVAAQLSVPTDVRSAQTHDSVAIETQDTPHKGFFLTRTYQLRHPRFDGTTSDVLPREVFVGTDATIVLPYDPARDRVLLVEQFRMGPFGRGDVHPWVLEPVAGRIDAGETPEATAFRECQEEAGLALRGIEHISSHYCSPGASTEYFHCYLGLCNLPDMEQGQGGLEAEHEDIRTHVLPYEAAAALLTSGEANNGPLVLMLIWLKANRSRLRAAA
ncbi:NUDIX domain-containing protein [Roseovarius sp. 2305UL8-3]|uniref:NUDIX domain-containing protein n=1 Tax=Roseovarius conchicola TaxID=3121636 RepID=UPI0035284C4F